MSASVQSVASTGSSGVVVDIECGLSNNLPNIVIVGLANRAVDEAKERIRGAFADSRITLPRKRITVNLAPADIPKDDSGFDLAIAVSILLASQQITPLRTRTQAFIGELGLDGHTRAVRGIIGKLLTGRAGGINTFYIPVANLKQARLVPHISLVAVDSLRQLYDHLTGVSPLGVLSTGHGKYRPVGSPTAVAAVQFSDIAGQLQAKRALEIAAAGGHNVFFSGPPGTGKSMLAKSLPSILPPLNREEILEVTQLHSLANQNYEQIIAERPFRAPHHSASHVAVIGGGRNLRPGEISLAHRGVLFFDELPEFSRITLEALRQPLEDRVISVARAKNIVEYPAGFILVATANPCPCGYYGTSGTCRCHPYQVMRYQRRLSGPILDRIDLFSSVHEIEHDKLLKKAAGQKSYDEICARINQARARQRQRFGGASKLNADMTNSDIRRFAHLEKAAIELLNTAAMRLNISARAYMRSVKVARTIADLEQSKTITVNHISEAIAYRRHETSEMS